MRSNEFNRIGVTGDRSSAGRRFHHEFTTAFHRSQRVCLTGRNRPDIAMTVDHFQALTALNIPHPNRVIERLTDDPLAIRRKRNTRNIAIVAAQLAPLHLGVDIPYRQAAQLRADEQSSIRRKIQTLDSGVAA
jgi:hypothetical protein